MTVSDHLLRWRTAGDRRRLGRAGLQATALGAALLVTPLPVGFGGRLALAATAAVALLALAWQQRPSLGGLAAAVDRSAGTRGLLSAGLGVERGGASGSADLQARVRGEAAAAAPSLAAHAIPPWRVPWLALAAAAATVGATRLAPAPVAASLAAAGWASPVFDEAELGAEGGPEAGGGARSPWAALAGRADGPRGDGRAATGDARSATGAAGRATAGQAGSAEAAVDRATAPGGEDAPADATEAQKPRRTFEVPELPTGALEMQQANDQSRPPGEDDQRSGKGGVMDPFSRGGWTEDGVETEQDLQGGNGDGTGQRGDGASGEEALSDNGEAADGGEGERKEGTGEGKSGAAGDPSQGTSAARGDDSEAESEDSEAGPGPSNGAGGAASGSTDAEAGPALPDLAFDLEQVAAPRGRGGAGEVHEAGEAALGQEAARALRALPEAYREAAEGALADDTVPPSRRDAVRTYFDTLASGGAP